MPPQIKSAQELYSWLVASARDGGQSALRDVAEFARIEDESLAQRPAAAALLAWGKLGREALAQNAITTPTVKNLISAFHILSFAATGTNVSDGQMYIHSKELAELINSRISDRDLRDVSRIYLSEVLHRVPTEDLLIPLGTTFSFLGTTDGPGSQELIRAMSARWMKVGPSTLATYENMLKTERDNESAFQKFFSEHPQLLDPMAIQVWAQPDFHGAHEPDFVIRRADDSYVIIEIECPSKRLLTQAGQLSAEATHAEKQATDYRSFLNERVVEVKRHFPNYRGSDCLTIVGVERDLTQQQAVALSNANAARHNVRIVGFDWLSQRARTSAENMSNGEVELIERYRII